MKKSGLMWVAASLLAMCAVESSAVELKISREEYEDKVYASWLGQCIGNIYGLPHENQYVDSPGEERFPYGYGPMLEELKKCNGAFSDDDTDLEYMDLLAMEKHGIEPTYEQMAGMWTRHIKNYIWIANRAALAMMLFGYTPPVTGMECYNPHWFQIDPQLINEIWAVTAPGMVSYATDKSAWGARITNSGWGIEATQFYGALYAAAFFETDIGKLLDIAIQAMPKEARFSGTVRDIQSIHAAHPDDWKKAREILAQKYYHEEPAGAKTIWNANLNGACGILALLYGEGDFQKTLDYACAIGFDADNQAATMAGLVAIMHGTRCLPKELLFPLPELGWKEPFNDFYKNRTREEMPDASLKDISHRTVLQGIKIIEANRGKTLKENGKEMLLIQSEAIFAPPIEIPKQPLPHFEVGRQVDFEICAVGPVGMKWSIASGALPAGLTLADGRLSGVPAQAGLFKASFKVECSEGHAERAFELFVRGENLARKAEKILAPAATASKEDIANKAGAAPIPLFAESVEVLRDSNLSGEGSTFNSFVRGPQNGPAFFGYEWKEPQGIGLMSYTTGVMEGGHGWLLTLGVEWMDSNGKWQTVKNLTVTPPLVPGSKTENKPHWAEYILQFDPVQTRAIRMIGEPNGRAQGPDDLEWVSITELSAHEPLKK